MDLKQYRSKLIGSKDERAVSPVIGVILMVAITVILAAVIAAFVLDMGDMGDTAPTVSFDWDESDSGVTISHTSGDALDPDKISLNGIDGDSDTKVSTWADSGDITAGKSVDVESDGSSDKIQIVWESDDGSSQVLDDYEVN